MTLVYASGSLAKVLPKDSVNSHNELKARLKYDDDDIAALGTMLSYAILDNAEITAIGDNSRLHQHLADQNGHRLTTLQHDPLNTIVLIDITNVAKAIAEWFAERS